MLPCRQLRDLGQSLWLDQIDRALLDTGTLARYISEFGVTGLTSNPSIFDQAIAGSSQYDRAIAELTYRHSTPAAIFDVLALADLKRAAALFLPAFTASAGRDGWVSMEVPPDLAHNAADTVTAARRIAAEAGTANMLIKIPGTVAGLAAIAQCIFEGLPINVTLLFSPAHYLAAVNAYLSGLERRAAAGLGLQVTAVGSLFVSRWDKAANRSAPPALQNRLGIAIAGQTYQAHVELLASARWHALAAAGARPMRLLWASTGVKDPGANPSLYVEALAAPDTVNTLPEATLLAFAKAGTVRQCLSTDPAEYESVLSQFRHIGIDPDALAAQLQQDGVAAFQASWQHLLKVIASKGVALATARRLQT